MNASIAQRRAGLAVAVLAAGVVLNVAFVGYALWFFVTALIEIVP